MAGLLSTTACDSAHSKHRFAWVFTANHMSYFPVIKYNLLLDHWWQFFYKCSPNVTLHKTSTTALCSPETCCSSKLGNAIYLVDILCHIFWNSLWILMAIHKPNALTNKIKKWYMLLLQDCNKLIQSFNSDRFKWWPIVCLPNHLATWTHSSSLLIAPDRRLQQGQADILLRLVSESCVLGEWLWRLAWRRVVILSVGYFQIQAYSGWFLPMFFPSFKG